jgi:hypothetical protein
LVPWPARQQPLEAVLSYVQRELPEIVAGQDIEGTQLHLVVVLAGMQGH